MPGQLRLQAVTVAQQSPAVVAAAAAAVVGSSDTHRQSPAPDHSL
jgi:hypothetical protein